MGFRERIQDYRQTVTLGFGVLVAACVVYIGWQFTNSQADPRFGTGSALFSSDDGKTFFRADSANIPPFEHEGKQAVQAIVYTAGAGKPPFVGYLMRFTPRGKEKMTEMRRNLQEKGGMPTLDAELQANTEVKRPGDANWVKLSDVAGSSRILQVTVPGDPSKPAEPVEP